MTVTISRHTGIPGITYEVCHEHLAIRSSRNLRIVSTAPVGAEHASVRDVLSILAPANLDCHRPHQVLEEKARSLGLAPAFVGFLTAVYLENAVRVTRSDEAHTVTVIATVGISNASRPGEELAAYTPGTINLVVLIDGDLPPNALHEALALTAEAKALSVYESGVRTMAGMPATGTSTDAYAVACTGNGPYQRYAGSVSRIGFLVGRAVRDAVAEGLGPALERMRGEGRR